MHASHLHRLAHWNEAPAVRLYRNRVQAKAVRVWRSPGGYKDRIHFQSVDDFFRVEIRELYQAGLHTGGSGRHLGGEHVGVEVDWPWVNEHSLGLQHMAQESQLHKSQGMAQESPSESINVVCRVVFLVAVTYATVF
jgi:hypothetical protein